MNEPTAPPPPAPPPGLSQDVWRRLCAARHGYLVGQEHHGEVEPLAREAARRHHFPLDEDFCMLVADHYDAAPARTESARTREGYAALAVQSLRQFRHLRAAGVRIEPWHGSGQPYHGLRELLAGLTATGVLYVYPTSAGHGPSGSPADHPLGVPSGVRVGGTELVHNDILRAVHDLFGHALHGAPMSAAGELRAAYQHMALYSAAAHPVLFTEQVAQVCWFFYGPHLRDRHGRVPARGEPGWQPPGRRPYPPQKVFAAPPEFVARFTASFREESP